MPLFAVSELRCILLVALCHAATSLEQRRYAPVEEFQLGVQMLSGVTRHSRYMPKKTVSKGQLYWPSPMGRLARYGVSQFSGPRNLTASLSWTWNHPSGRYNTIIVGAPLIDNEMNIYVAADDGVRKFSCDGEVLWTYNPRGPLATSPSMLKGVPAFKDEKHKFQEKYPGDHGMVYAGPQLFASTTNGYVFALDLKTGQENFAVKASTRICGVKGTVGAAGHVVVAATNHCYTRYCAVFRYLGNMWVRGLSVIDGQQLWKFMPDTAVWNFVPLFPGDGSVLFQDVEGTVYRLDMETGELLWKQEGQLGTYTPGAASLGANDAVFSVIRNGPDTPYTQGIVRAHKIKDGTQLWKAKVQGPPAGPPAVGRVDASGRLRVVLPTGQACNAGAVTKLIALDAKMGTHAWTFDGPTLPGPHCAGDEIGVQIRNSLGVRSACVPNAWSNPTIDGQGNIYIGNQIGKFYGLGKSETGPGISEFTSAETGSALQDFGAAVVPGMLAVVTCDTLIVLRIPNDAVIDA